MELSWAMKFRIAAAIAVGVVLIGVLGWPLGAPEHPPDVVSIPSGTKAMLLVALAVVTGMLGYFVSWPYGREIGILAVPAGLAVWGIRSADMASLLQQDPSLAQRQEVLAAVKWEPLFWLGIVAAGLLGTMLAQLAVRQHTRPATEQAKPRSPAEFCLNAALALVGSVLIAQFCVRLLAQDVRMPDSTFGSVVGQPAVGQIVFAVVLGFGVTAFLVKRFLNAGYVWCVIASGFITAFTTTLYIRQGTLEHLVRQWPPVFYSNAILAILPVQMVALGTLGSVAGYWLAVEYGLWRKQQGV